MNKPRILVVLASTRPGRKGEPVAYWVMEQIKNRTDAAYELVDLRDYKLPYFDYPTSAEEIQGNYKDPTEKAWVEKVQAADGYLIITCEYNHSYPAVLKSALDIAYHEWNKKAVGFVSYGGGAGGARAVEHLKLIAVELQMAPIRNAVNIPGIEHGALDDNGNPTNPRTATSLSKTVDQLIWWTNALKTARAQE